MTWHGVAWRGEALLTISVVDSRSDVKALLFGLSAFGFQVARRHQRRHFDSSVNVNFSLLRDGGINLSSVNGLACSNISANRKY